MSERTWFLSRVLRIQSIFTLLVGVSWIITSTTNRLAGVAWLEYAIALFPTMGGYEVNADTVIGVGWVLAAVVMAVSGWFGCRVKGLENLGFAVGVFWPLLAGAIFMVAFLQGAAPNGWITTIVYLSFTTPYLVLLGKFNGAGEVSLDTESIPIPGTVDDGNTDHTPS